MTVTADPILHRDEHTQLIEAEINRFLLETIFEPLRAILESRTRENSVAVSALWYAISENTVCYAGGVFTGEFNAEVSRELRAIGATKSADGFHLAQHDLPFALRGIIALSRHRGERLHAEVIAFLLLVEANLPQAETGIKMKIPVDKVVRDLQQQLVRTIAATSAPIAVPPPPPELVEQAEETVKAEIEREIKNFSFEEVQKIRARVQQNLSGGGRTDRLADIIESEFGVSQRKARIIADSETSLLVSNFRRRRYEALGCVEYIWDTSHDEKVRPTHGESNNHRILDGRKFAWAVPPVVDSATGRRRHPGEDYGPCRCVARPVLNFA